MLEACAIRGYSHWSVTSAAHAPTSVEPNRGICPALRVTGPSVSFMRPGWATLLRAEPRGAWFGRRLGLLVAADRRLVFRRLARAARHVLLPIAPCRFQAGIRLLTGGRNHLLDGSPGILMVIELGRRGALRLAEVGIALEVVGQRREAHRKVVPIAQPNAQRPVRGEGQIA